MSKSSTTNQAASVDLTSVITKAATGTGAAVAAVGGLTLTEWMGVIGVLIALAGAVGNWWHNRKVQQLAEREDQRKAEEHELRIAEYRLRIEAIKNGDADRRRRSIPVDFDRRRGGGGDGHG